MSLQENDEQSHELIKENVLPWFKTTLFEKCPPIIINRESAWLFLFQFENRKLAIALSSQAICSQMTLDFNNSHKSQMMVILFDSKNTWSAMSF